jgi:DNA polymerase III epsilon subunit-like protein
VSLLREYIRGLLIERRLSGRTIEGVLKLLDGYADNTWIFFDTETTGLHPKSAQLTEIGAIAVDPNDWADAASMLGQFNEKIKLTPETLGAIEQQSTEDSEPGKGKSIQDILSMTRYEEEDRAYGDEQEIIDQFFKFVESFPNPLMIAQNAAFDLRMLSVRSGGKLPRYPVLDTKQLMDLYLLPLLRTQTQAEQGNPEAQALLDKLYVNKGNWGHHSTSMGIVSDAYGINIDDWHSALADVKMMMEMYRMVVQTIQRGMGVDISKEHEKAVALQKKLRKLKP